MINLKSNIQDYGKLKTFIGLYYEWGCDAKVLYPKMTMKKDVNKLLDGHKNFIGSEVDVKKTPGDTGTTLSKSDFEKPKEIDKYRSFLGQLMRYNI